MSAVPQTDRLDPLQREVVTPEGVALRMRLGSRGDRIAACIIDLTLQLVALFLFIIVVSIVGLQGLGGPLLNAVILLFLFLLQFAYFPFFELRWNGATPGKRMVGIRVVDARGGPLDLDAILARNLMRHLETFVPLILVVSETLSFGAPLWIARMLGVLWGLGLLAYPLFDRDVRRVGDLVAGTLVVRVPKASLERDVGDTRSRARRPVTYEFTREQLSHYGIYELQVLEDLLRTAGRDSQRVAHRVCRAIQGRIEWPAEHADVDVDAFLRDFYRLQREELERKLQFGERKEFKTPREKPRDPGGRTRRR